MAKQEERHPQIPSQQEIKDFYAEVGLNYRYFLDWRHKLLAGYLAAIAGLAIGFGWSIKEAPEYAFYVPIFGILLTLVFWAFDYRTRDLYHACQNSGNSLEEDYKVENGVFTHIKKITFQKDPDESKKTKKSCWKKMTSHSHVINGMYIVLILFFIFGATQVYNSKGKPKPVLNEKHSCRCCAIDKEEK